MTKFCLHKMKAMFFRVKRLQITNKLSSFTYCSLSRRIHLIRSLKSHMSHPLKVKSTSSPSEQQPVKINRGLVFSIIAMALLMNTIDSTIVATALHTLQQDLNTTVSWVGWTMTARSEERSV